MKYQANQLAFNSTVEPVKPVTTVDTRHKAFCLA